MIRFKGKITFEKYLVMNTHPSIRGTTYLTLIITTFVLDIMYTTSTVGLIIPITPKSISVKRGGFTMENCIVIKTNYYYNSCTLCVNIKLINRYLTRCNLARFQHVYLL